MMAFGSLFSGIGGMDKGLTDAGMQPIWQSEIDPFCLRVLAKHWPEVKRYGDIKEIDWTTVERPDLICAGYPCQPVSVAGKRRAQQDERWLWPEVARAVRLLRPRWVLLENVPGHLTAGFGDVLGDLAGCGYDAEWTLLSAAAFGAPHIRERVWIVAYPDRQRQLQPQGCEPHERRWARDGSTQNAPDPNGERCQRPELFGQQCNVSAWVGDSSWWEVERQFHGVPDGLSAGLDRYRRQRLKVLGNSVVPQIVEWIGRRIVEVDANR